MSKSTLTVLQPTMEEFGAWLRGQTPGHGSVKATVLHHTWSPSSQQFTGRDTVVGIRRYHMAPVSQGGRGFGDVAANAYACPDGTVITGRPLDTGNWAHALISRPGVEREAREIAGGNKQFFNSYGFGLETVANFDEEDPHGGGTAGRSYETGLRVLAIVHQVYGLPADRLFLHRDVADKSCPGNKLARAGVRTDLAQRLAGGGLGIVRLGHPTDLLIDCHPVIINGACWVDFRTCAEALGAEAGWEHNKPILKVNGVVVDISAWAVAPASGPTRVPLRQLLGAVGWRVKEPLHLQATPPRIYVEKKAG